MRFFPLYAGVWGIKVNNDYTDTLYSVLQPERMVQKEMYVISDVKVIENIDTTYDVTLLTKKYTKAEVIQTPGSFYYGDFLLLIHFPNSNTPYYYPSETTSILLSSYEGFYKSNSKVQLDLSGIEFEPRLLEVPKIGTKRDNVLAGIQTYDSGTVIIQNADGAYNHYVFGRDNTTRETSPPKIGLKGRLKVALLENGVDPVFEDFKTIFAGKVKSITENNTSDGSNSFKIDMIDIRRSMTDMVGAYELDMSEWPLFYPEEQEDKPSILIPHIYGKVRGVPCPCLNENAIPGVLNPVYYYLLGYAPTDMVSINKVYLENIAITDTPTIQYLTQADGRRIAYFEIIRERFIVLTGTAEAVTQSYKSFNTISADVSGIVDENDLLMDNALDIAKHLLIDTLNISFSNYYFNMIDWTAVSLTAPKIGMYINQPTELNSLIEDIQRSFVNTEFQIEKDTLFYTWKDFNWDDTSYLCTITPDLLLNGRTGVSPKVDSESVAANIKMEYNQNYSKSEFYTKIDKTNSGAARKDYDSNATLPADYKTLLYDTADVNDQITRLSKILWYPNTQFDISIPANIYIQSVRAFDLRAGDFVRLLANTDVKLVYGYILCEIVQTSPDFINNTIGLTLRVAYTYGNLFMQPTLIKSSFSGKYLGNGHVPYVGII